MDRNHLLIRFLRGLLQPIFSLIFYGLKKFRVHHSDRLPTKRQALILCCNHAAFVDSIYLILAVKSRFTICGAKPHYFSTPFRRLLMNVANIIKVENHQQFLQDCSTLLATGEILLIYPEMGRNPDNLGIFKTWAAEVALQNQVPILPCYLFGTTHGHTGSPRLIVGDKIAPQSDANALTHSLRSQIVALAPEQNSVIKDNL
jgi:1-acyl-sn-glycerol-3-phosphate acyltransferase